MSIAVKCVTVSCIEGFLQTKTGGVSQYQMTMSAINNISWKERSLKSKKYLTALLPINWRNSNQVGKTIFAHSVCAKLDLNAQYTLCITQIDKFKKNPIKKHLLFEKSTYASEKVKDMKTYRVFFSSSLGLPLKS